MRSILQLGSSVFTATFAVLLLLGIAATASNARADQPLFQLTCVTGCGCSTGTPPCNDDNCGHGSCPVDCECGTTGGSCSCNETVIGG